MSKNGWLMESHELPNKASHDNPLPAMSRNFTDGYNPNPEAKPPSR